MFKKNTLTCAAFIAASCAASASLVINYDAANASSITKVGDNVSQWSDSAGLGQNFTNAGMIQGASSALDSGQQGILWNQIGRSEILSSANADNIFDFNTTDGGAAGNDGFTILSAFEILDFGVATNGNNIIAGGGGNQNPNIKIIVQPSGSIQVRMNDTTTDNNFTTDTGMSLGQTVVFGVSYTASTGVVTYVDSLGNTDGMTISANADLNSTTPSFFSGSSNVGQQTDGIFGAFQIYNNTMDATALSTAVSDLGNVWIVPEPSTYAMFAGLGALALVVIRRRLK